MGDEYDVLRSEVDGLLSEYGDQSYLLYAMGLRLSTTDYDTLRTDNTLDGPDDKKIDFFHIDSETGIGTIAQAFQSPDWSKPAAPASKASDLNTALAWLFESSLTDIPREDVRASAEQLRDGLENGDITRVEVFFLHNLPKGDEIDREIATVQLTLNRLLSRFGQGKAIPPVGAVQQISRESVEEWRRAQNEAVTIRDEVVLTSTIPPQRLHTPEWEAVILSVPVDELIELRRQYNDALFSANVRDYLGSRQSAKNINLQIEKTVKAEPKNFWVYNNGITVLTNGITVDDKTRRVTLSGIAVINGAQTTGSLAEAAAQGKLAPAEVLVRAIKSIDQKLIKNIILYNNTQNPIKPWELRVIDPIQARIRDEFQQIHITYQLRRGVGRQRSPDVDYEKLAPYLSAFYGDPIAAQSRAELFGSDTRYRKLFDEQTNVRNCLFIYRIGNAVMSIKTSLKNSKNQGTATEDELSQQAYFHYGAFSFLLIHASAEILLQLSKNRDPEFKKRVTYKDSILLKAADCEALLSKLVQAILRPIPGFLKNKDAYQMLKTKEGIDEITGNVKNLFGQVDLMHPATYKEFVIPLKILR